MTVGALLGECLRLHGVRRVFGLPLVGIETARVESPRAAALLAAAEGRIGSSPGVAHLPDATLLVTGGPGGEPHEVEATTGAALVAAVRDAFARARAPVPTPTRIRTDLELTAVRPAGLEPAGAEPDPSRVEPGEAIRDRVGRAERPVILVGPGVVRAGAVPGLHALATAVRAGVANTWGAKGVFDWRSPHHLGTVGLQERDLDLVGLDDADLVLECGIDETELVGVHRPDRESLAVAPAMLDPLAEVCARPWREIGRGPLFGGLAAVTQRGWAVEGAPLHPARTTRTYAEILGSGGLVAADPGVAGFWVARTFPTSRAGSVHVPGAAGAAGFAVGAVGVARLDHPTLPALAVVDGPLDPATRDVLEALTALGVAVPLEVWDPGGDRVSACEHDRRLRAALLADRSRLVTVAYDPAPLAEVVAVAGEVVAWGGRIAQGARPGGEER